MTTSIQHVNVMVDDLDAAIDFYGNVLGFALDPTPDMGFPAQFFGVGGGQQIHVNQLDDVHAERAHFCLRLDDFNAVFARALERGIFETGTWGPAKRLPSGTLQAFVRDPAGNLIELACDADYPADPAIFELDFFDSSSL